MVIVYARQARGRVFEYNSGQLFIRNRKTLAHIYIYFISSWAQVGVSNTDLMTVCFYHATYAFRVSLYPVITWISCNSLLKVGAIAERKVTGWVFVYELSGCEFHSRCRHDLMLTMNMLLPLSYLNERWDVLNGIQHQITTKYQSVCMYV